MNRCQGRKTDPVGSVALCLLLEISLGSRDVKYYFILLSILPSRTTVAPVSFPRTVRYIVQRHQWYVRACEKLKLSNNVQRRALSPPVLPAAALLLPLLRPSDFLSLPSLASLIAVRVGIRRGNADPARRVRLSKTMAVEADDASTAPSIVQPEPPSPPARSGRPARWAR